MAYIGIQPAEKFTSFATQEFSTSATTSYTLDHAVANENEIALFVNNVRQQPGSGKAYTATGTALTLSAATASTDTMYCIFLGRALQTVTPATNSITAAMVGNDLISGKTALGAEPADTDEFLVSDAGTLKRVDYSYIKGGGITMADQWRWTADFTGDATPITANWERNDTNFDKIGTGMSESSGVFTFPSTGIYRIDFWTGLSLNSASKYSQLTIRLSTDGGSNYSSNTINYTHISHVTSSTTYASLMGNTIIDVTNTSNFKVDFSISHHDTNTNVRGDTTINENATTFIRLGDT